MRERRESKLQKRAAQAPVNNEAAKQDSNGSANSSPSKPHEQRLHPHTTFVSEITEVVSQPTEEMTALWDGETSFNALEAPGFFLRRGCEKLTVKRLLHIEDIFADLLLATVTYVANDESCEKAKWIFELLQGMLQPFRHIPGKPKLPIPKSWCSQDGGYVVRNKFIEEDPVLKRILTTILARHEESRNKVVSCDDVNTVRHLNRYPEHQACLQVNNYMGQAWLCNLSHHKDTPPWHVRAEINVQTQGTDCETVTVATQIGLAWTGLFMVPISDGLAVSNRTSNVFRRKGLLIKMQIDGSCKYCGKEADDSIEATVLIAAGATPETRILKCKCRTVSYCSVDCQRKDWPDHKQHCRQLGEERKNLKIREKMLEDTTGNTKYRTNFYDDKGGELPRKAMKDFLAAPRSQ